MNFILLFGSASTLVCCALPALLVSLGLGATLAGLASHVPALIWLSENKLLVFLVSGILIIINGVLIWKNRHAPCPVDPVLGQVCQSTRKSNVIFYFISLGLYLTGFSFAFLLT